MSLRRTQCALLVSALIFAVAAAHSAGADELAGTLPEDYLPALKPILATALKQSPRVIGREIEISRREAQVLMVDAQRRPRVDGHLDYARTQTAVSGNTGTQSNDGGFFYGLVINQPLYHWGALENQSAATRIEVAIAEKNLVETYRQVVAALRQRYLSLIIQKASLRQARHSLGLAESDLALTKDNFERGLVSRDNRDSQQRSFDEAALGLERAEVDFASQRRAFARIAGIADLTEDELPAEIPKPVYSSGAAAGLASGFLRDGGKGTFQAQLAEMQIRQAELSYRIAQVRLLPKINLSAAYSLENTTNATTTSVLQQGVARETVAVTAQWNIWDGFASKGAKADALAAKHQFERDLKNAAEDAQDHVQLLQRQIAFDARALEFTETRQTLSDAELSHAQEELERGKSSKRAVAGVLTNTYGQTASTYGARATLMLHWAELVSLTGADPVLKNLPDSHAREPR